MAALATWVGAMALNGDGDAYGWMWVVMAALGLAALVVGWSTRAGAVPRGRALAGALMGGLLVLLFLGFVIGDAISG